MFLPSIAVAPGARVKADQLATLLRKSRTRARADLIVSHGSHRNPPTKPSFGRFQISIWSGPIARAPRRFDQSC